MATPNDFLSNLGGMLNQQFSASDGKNSALDIVQYGQSQNYGQLGGFSNATDASAQRSYTEEGSFRTNFYNPQPKQLEILMQDPDITVLVKKRAFSSLSENYRPDLMDSQEALFFRTTKILFQNKCQQLSAYEKLAKISQISTEIGQVDYNLLPIIFSATDTLTQGFGALGLDSLQSSINGALSKFKNIVDRVREVVSLAQDNTTTTWITNVPDSFRSTFAEGTGVIEFTNINSLSTTTTLKFGQGSFSVNFIDPYEVMLITNLDIEQAINDATNVLYNNQFTQLGLSSLDQIITDQKNTLNATRASRGANPIIFNVSPDNYAGKVVMAIIDNIGFQINYDPSSGSIDPSAQFGSEAIGNDGLNDSDIGIFNSIISMLNNQISLSANIRRMALQNNQNPDTNYNSVRKRLRLHYGNKLVIQPMDNIHIFINSKKRIDKKISGGLQSSFGGQGFLQGLTNLTQEIQDVFAINETYAIEKSVFVGNDFPNWLWQILRGSFISEKTGTQVFSGIVEKANSSYNAGAFTVTVNGVDSAGYFNYGVVNFKPSVDVFNGGLYDPLTPFKLEFDSATGALKYQKDGTPELLSENKFLFGSAFVKNKNGLLAGISPTESGYLKQDADRIKNTSVRRVFYDPDGMIYRWKEGIATLVLFGDSYESNPSNSPAPAITADPFAGQDLMNVLSLLITGEPYNFATFYKAAVQFDNFKRDSSTNQEPSNSYFRGLKTQLKSRNSLYGNFVPFKQLTMDEASLVQVLNNQLNVTQYDSELQGLLQQRATLADKLSILGKTNLQSLSNGTADDKLIANTVNGIDTQINDRLSKINTELNSSNSPVTIVGDDVSFDYDSSDTNTDGDKTHSDPNYRKALRRKVSLLTKRLAWKVRANEDVNFLIVDDTYDKDYDIQAFIKTPTNPELFKSEYLTVADKINNMANVMRGLEVFANTQGHIEIRNPKYNKVPSSVFYKMFQMKNELGIQIYPQFLEDLFANQFNTLVEQIEVLEDEIRVYCIALGYTDDRSDANFINTNANIGGIHSMGGYLFLSNPDTGKITNATSNFNFASNPDIVLGYIKSNLGLLNPQNGISVFSIANKINLVQSASLATSSNNSSNPQQFSNISTILDQQSTQDLITKITSRLNQKTGQSFDFSQLFSNTNSGTIKMSTISSVDILQIANNISSRLSQRQNAIKSAANALKNIQEGLQLFSGSGGQGDQSGGNSMLSPSLYNSRSIPKVFEHMIEDESYDDLGTGSGQRYVIKNHDIISYSISENRPPFTSIEVVGRFGDQFFENNQLPQDLNVFQSGNALVTAAAVDYDLWRMYGIALPTSIDAPYLSDPNTQCAPYAVSLLNKARKEILGGTVEIVGNEFQQPGEIVYIENRDLLFYVESVTHQFTYGRGFNTSMNISYGHNPGEYIPTFLDVVGKSLYNSKNVTNLVHKRQGNVFNQEHVGTIMGSYGTSGLSNNPFNGGTSSSPDNDITNGQFGSFNRLALQHIIDFSKETLSLNADNINPMLEIRIYTNSDTQFTPANTYAQQLQQTIYNYLIGASTLSGNAQPTGNQSSNTQSLSAFKAQIAPITVNTSVKNSGEFRYPSSKAFYYARQAISQSSSSLSGGPAQQGPALQKTIDNVIYGFVVDCWIVFNNPNTTNTEPGF